MPNSKKRAPLYFLRPLFEEKLVQQRLVQSAPPTMPAEWLDIHKFKNARVSLKISQSD